jgi:hypothetical protein
MHPPSMYTLNVPPGSRPCVLLITDPHSPARHLPTTHNVAPLALCGLYTETFIATAASQTLHHASYFRYRPGRTVNSSLAPRTQPHARPAPPVFETRAAAALLRRPRVHPINAEMAHFIRKRERPTLLLGSPQATKALPLRPPHTSFCRGCMPRAGRPSKPSSCGCCWEQASAHAQRTGLLPSIAIACMLLHRSDKRQRGAKQMAGAAKGKASAVLKARPCRPKGRGRGQRSGSTVSAVKAPKGWGACRGAPYMALKGCQASQLFEGGLGRACRAHGRSTPPFLRAPRRRALGPAPRRCMRGRRTCAGDGERAASHGCHVGELLEGGLPLHQLLQQRVRDAAAAAAPALAAAADP